MTLHRTSPVTIGITFLLLSLFAYHAHSQGKKDCGIQCFSTEILGIQELGDCDRYEIQVTYSGTCNFELSHYDFDPGCGAISDASNSIGWPMELNHTDPTTGLGGLKVDNISSFGKDPDFTSFKVWFTFCPDETCDENAGCLIPRTAYKAGQCVYYEDIDTQCNEEDPLKVSVEKRDPRCSGSTDGNIQLTVTGGQAPYSVSWNSGHVGAVLDNLGAGSYEYSIRDQSADEVHGVVIIQEPTALGISGQVDHITCGISSQSGAIDINVSGGTGPYAFLWSSGETSEDIDPQTEGRYTVSVTDVNGCASEKSFNLLTTTDIMATATLVHPSCDGSRQGSIDLAISGGTMPYTITWTGTDQTGASISGLTDNYYAATITDANGCSLKRTYSIKTVVDIEVDDVITSIHCNETTGGAIDLTITGGLGPYKVVWEDGLETEDRNDLESGKYSAIVMDERGCVVSYSGYVKVDQIYVYPVQKTDPTCAGMTDGSIDLKVYFGEGPYEYHWSDGSSAESRDNLGAGSYFVEVTDANGCTADNTIELSDPNGLSVHFDLTPPGCNGEAGYNIMAFVEGGSGDYSYFWSTGDITSGINGVTAGTYTLTVTDANGCSMTQEVKAEGGPGSYSCLIQESGFQPTCGSGGNVLNALQEGVLSYSWWIESTDGSWQIDGASDGAQIIYTAGNEGTSAVFYLDVTFEDGCTASCILSLTACDGIGGGDPGDGEEPEVPDDKDPKNKDCTDCFYTDPIEVTREGNTFHYTILVQHKSYCRYDLSHVSVAIPECAMIKDYSNSMGWPMEVVHPDPTTGITGIKVDDIPAFGKDSGPESFEIYISLTSQDPSCFELLTCFEPEIAYKAAACVFYEIGQGGCLIPTSQPRQSAYPNPTEDFVFISPEYLEEGTTYTLELFNSSGLPLNADSFKASSDVNATIDLSALKDGFYFIKITDSEGNRNYFKVLKK